MDKIHLGPRKVLRAPALRRGREVIPISDRVKLDRVLGFTVSSNAAFDCDPHSSIVAYPAGCVVVVYNVRKNKQGHILSSSKKTITSLAFSADGKYLATGECGHLPHLRVWDVQEKVQVAEFQGHKYGINCVAFSPNLKYVVSVGSQHDMIVNVWDWKNNVKVASNKVSCKVKAVSFSAKGDYFVTVGNRHVKFWYLEYSRSAKYKMEPVPLMGRSAILGDQRNNNFCDVACGKGKMSESTYAITKSGLLCEFNSRRLLDKWVELRTTSANSISVGEQFIFIGCAEGIIRCFSPADLNFKCTLPRPHCLGVDVSKGTVGTRQAPPQSSKLRYPDTVAIAADEINNKVTCIYNDHSLYVWDIKDMKKIGKSHSFMYHSACIWGIETYSDLPEETNGILPKGTFLTCSSDDTIRIWNTELGAIQGTAYQRSIYSPELLKVLYVDPELTYLCDTDFNPSGSNDKVDTTYDGKNGVRCLRISPNGKHLASGDRSGNIRIHDLEFYEELYKVEAHDSEVLCLEYSKPILVGGNEKEYLASASRDRLIHVFDVKEDYAFQQTLDDHSSSITAVRFVHNGNMLQMISCGADKSIIFRKAQFNPHLAFIREHHVVGKTTLYDMEVDNQQHHILTACQDRNIRVYSVQSGKHGRCFRGSQGEDGTLIKVILDPSGTYLATSCTDKSLYVYDYYSGECLASMFGHSELVTGLKFTNNGSHLISVSGDSCIFLWKLPSDLTQTMLNKQSISDTTLPNLWHESRKGAIAITKPIQLSQNTSEDFNSNLVSAGNIGEIHESSPNAYRFSVGQLPLWAKKQMLDELKPSTVSPNKVTDPRMLPRCRWAQRIDSQGLVVRSYLDSDAVIPFPGNSGHEEGNSKTQNENKDSLDGPEDGVVYRTKNENPMSFEVSEQSLLEIKTGNITQEVGGIASKSTLRDTFPFNNELGDLSTAGGAMRLEDMDAEDERSDSEISEMVYYPASEDGSDAPDSTFHVCANVNNGLKEAQDTPKRFPNRERTFGDISTNNTSEQLETNSDDEDLSTPADSERSFLSSLCISTENLEKLDQREKFMKSNYESLERSDTTGMKDGEIEDRSLYRQSISAKFLAGSLCPSLRPVTSGRVTPSFTAEQKAATSTRKREELNKALSETRKKLETVGFRRGLMSSKSIGDLHNIPGKDSQRRMFFGTQDSDIRRAASMNDLSNSSFPRRRLFSNPGNARETATDGNDSAPLWSPKKSKENSSLLDKSENASVYSSSLNSSMLINGDKMSNKTETFASLTHNAVTPSSAKSRNLSLPSTMRQTPSGNASPQYKQSSYSTLVAKGIAGLNSVSNRRTNLPSLIAQRHVVTATSVPLATDSSSDSSPTESSPKPVVAPSFVYVPNEVGSEPPLSKFSSSENSVATNSFQSLKHRRLISRSEWDLKSFGDSKDSSFGHHNVPRFIRRQCLSESLQYVDSDAKSQSPLRLNSSVEVGQGDQPSEIVVTLPGDPTSVPITKELCEGISENLKKVTTCAIQVYQRLTLNSELPVEERNIMTDILAKGVWQAQQTLRPAIPPVPSWHPSSGFEGNMLNPRRLPGLGVQPGELHGLPSQHSSSVEPHIDNMDTMALLQQFSDKLLNIVQQKINSGSQEQSNT